MVRIDYNLFSPDHHQAIESQLNRLGKEGWELIMWQANNGVNATYIFKCLIK